MLKTIKIGPIRYDVMHCELDRIHGDLDTIKGRMRINSHQHADAKATTIWHEIIHGILFCAGVGDHDEQIVDAIAHGIVQVLRDNPDVITETTEHAETN